MARRDFNTRWAQNVETQDSSTIFQDPGLSRLGTGWEGGADKDAPPAGQENWWHNRVDSGLQDLERYGVMRWLASAIYAAGAPVKSMTDGNYYESLVNSNTGNDPVSTSGYWKLLGSSLYNVVPVGSGVIVYHNNVPDTGWLKCNGAVLLRSTYPRLFAAIGTLHNTGGEASTQFRLPDMRGEFPRGWDDGKGVDPNRNIGSAQADAIQNIIGSLNARPLQGNFPGTVFGGTGAFTSAVKNGPAGTNSVPSENITTRSDTIGFDASLIVRTANETRGRNKAVNFWIKY